MIQRINPYPLLLAVGTGAILLTGLLYKRYSAAMTRRIGVIVDLNHQITLLRQRLHDETALRKNAQLLAKQECERRLAAERKIKKSINNLSK